MIIRLKPFLSSVAVSLGISLASGFAVYGGLDFYQTLRLPVAAPSVVLFPILWILFSLLMGASAYFIWNSESRLYKKGLLLYGFHLVANALWPLFFFRGHWIFFSFLWLAFVWILTLSMISVFLRVSRTAAYLQIPQLLWLTFVGYLNICLFLLN